MLTIASFWPPVKNLNTKYARNYVVTGQKEKKKIMQQHLPYADTSILEIHPCFSSGGVSQKNRADSLVESVQLC